MAIMIFNAAEMLTVSVLCIANIINIQKLLLNYSENKVTKFLLVPYFILSISCSLFRDKEHPLIFLSSVLLFYSLLFIIQIISSSVSKMKALYITSVYMLIDSIIQSLSLIAVKLIVTTFNRSLIVNTASVIFGFIIFLAIKKANKAENQIRNSVGLLSRKIYFLILLTLLFIGNLCGNMTVDSYESLFNNKINDFLVVISILFLLIVIINFVFKSISKEYYANLSKQMEKAVKQQLKHYEKVNELNEELREFRHDYKNHMICLQAMMESEAYDQAEEYLRNITKQEVIESKNYFSGNRTADAILSDKNETAEKTGCYIKFSGCISDEITPAVLCTILSNALDNAIEACQRLKNDERFCINVECAVIQGVQIIKVCNPNNIDSTESIKADKKHHGFGLYNIRKTVEMLDGQMKIPQKVPEFMLELEFPIGNNSLK